MGWNLVTSTSGRKVRSSRPSLAVQWVWSQLELPGSASEGRKHQTVKLRWSVLSIVTWEWIQTQSQSFVTATFRSSVTSHITCQLCFVETWLYLKYYWNNYLNYVNITASQLIKTPRVQETRILIGWQWRVYSTIKVIEFFVWVQAGGRKKSAMRTWIHPITLLLNYKI